MLDLINNHKPTSHALASSNGPVLSLSDWAHAHNGLVVTPAANTNVQSLTQFMHEHHGSEAVTGPLHPDLRVVQPGAAPEPSRPRRVPLAASSASECYSRPDGSDYAGSQNVTRSGAACRSWAIEFSHRRDRHEPGAQPPPENFCRLVDPQMACAACYPACSTTAACRRNQLECCDIGLPHASCEPQHAGAASLQWPGAHAPPSPPGSDLPLSMQLLMRPRPGLLPTGPGTAPQLAEPAAPPPPVVPAPPPSAPPPDARECFSQHDASDYRGCRNVTVNGYVCQRWTAQWPNAHPYMPGTAEWERAGLGDHNYCRRPGGFACAWCYVDKGSPPPYAEKRGSRSGRRERGARGGADDEHEHGHMRNGLLAAPLEGELSVTDGRTALSIALAAIIGGKSGAAAAMAGASASTSAAAGGEGGAASPAVHKPPRHEGKEGKAVRALRALRRSRRKPARAHCSYPLSLAADGLRCLPPASDCACARAPGLPSLAPQDWDCCDIMQHMKEQCSPPSPNRVPQFKPAVQPLLPRPRPRPPGVLVEPSEPRRAAHAAAGVRALWPAGSALVGAAAVLLALGLVLRVAAPLKASARLSGPGSEPRSAGAARVTAGERGRPPAVPLAEASAAQMFML